jgi:hypothetical protein
MLKPLFGFDITEDINNQTFYADKFAVKKVDAEAFAAGLVDYMQGRVEIEPVGEYYSLFKVN